MPRFLLASLALFIVAFVPAVAEACPSCAGRDQGNVATLVLLGVMIALPSVIAYIGYRLIRKASAARAQIGRVS